MSKFWDTYDRLRVLGECRQRAVMVRAGTEYRIEFGDKPPKGTVLLASVGVVRSGAAEKAIRDR